MIGEIDILGVFVPALAIWMLIALGLGAGARAALSRLGLYRLVWRRPLFDLALYVVLLAFVVFLALRVIP